MYLFLMQVTTKMYGIGNAAIIASYILLIASKEIGGEGDPSVLECIKMLQQSACFSTALNTVQINSYGMSIAGQIFQLSCTTSVPSPGTALAWMAGEQQFIGNNVIIEGGNITFIPLLTSNGGTYNCVESYVNMQPFYVTVQSKETCHALCIVCDFVKISQLQSLHPTFWFHQCQCWVFRIHFQQTRTMLEQMSL